MFIDDQSFHVGNVFPNVLYTYLHRITIEWFSDRESTLSLYNSIPPSAVRVNSNLTGKILGNSLEKVSLMNWSLHTMRPLTQVCLFDYSPASSSVPLSSHRIRTFPGWEEAKPFICLHYKQGYYLSGFLFFVYLAGDAGLREKESISTASLPIHPGKLSISMFVQS